MEIQKDPKKVAAGKARAKALSSDERASLASKAANQRWHADLPRATHGSEDHPLRIGEIEIPCYVLGDGTRVLSMGGMIRGLGVSQRADRLAAFLGGKGLSTFVSEELTARIGSPIKFHPPRGGTLAYGYPATILADICDAVLRARAAGALQSQQKHIAEQCEILVRGFARVGIIALVDEATGYQEIRDKNALQAILDKYLAKELAAWAKRFPDEFYQQIFRLHEWEWRGMKVNRPGVVAHYTKDLVYKRLAPGILEELEKKNPIESGRRKSKHHQWLTIDVGHPALAQHLHAVIGLMRISGTWDQFMLFVDRAFPRKGDTLQLPLGD